MNKNLYKYISFFLGLLLLGLVCYMVYNQIIEYHLQDDPMLHILKEILKPLHPIVSKLQIYKGNKSYTINKQKIFICLKDENGDYYPINMLLHVLIHEIAHILNTKDIGHTPEFHRIFDELLEKATGLGIYNPSIPLIQNYCNYSDE